MKISWEQYTYVIHAWTLSIIAYTAEPSVSSNRMSFVTKPCKNANTSTPHTCTRDRCSSFWQDIPAAPLWLCLTTEHGCRQDTSEVIWLEYIPWKVTHLQSLNTGRNAFFNIFAQRPINILEWCRKCKCNEHEKLDHISLQKISCKTTFWTSLAETFNTLQCLLHVVPSDLWCSCATFESTNKINYSQWNV